MRPGATFLHAMVLRGPAMTNFVRWARNETLHCLLKVMQAAADGAGLVDWDGAALDATHIKAQRSVAGARKTLPAAGKRGP